ncbi:dihydrolipoyllysine-residue acetyltransferase [Spongiibacter nanhainus]|uniref:Acetyltransferase component of pyruvate dehydrogenase complex n=1 Tax=Spongiibacter nanhainus TaxID=2794344 RepID=A0A7T4UNT0_9GAMM|nr:dihydrolipoyllysine-residue acetyltransferase [Spongiibacter nanhainus]QQD16882.1 dihydrolipoyllysine-residue acetyltransferase [Spongiibacter nanhainus]
MATETIKIPDLGGGDDVEVIEVCVSVGDSVQQEDSLLVLESDKASMEVPAPKAGTVKSIALKVGDSVSEGDAILELEIEGDSEAEASDDASEADDAEASAEPEPDSEPDSEKDTEAKTESAPAQDSSPAPAAQSQEQTVKVPDVGGADGIEVIEVCVAEGDEVEEGDSLIVLESDKASMEVPAPYGGKVVSLLIKVGDNAAEGTDIAVMAVSGDDAAPAQSAADSAEDSSAHSDDGESTSSASEASSPSPAPAPQAAPQSQPAPQGADPNTARGEDIYAGPAVRKMAREFGIPLVEVKGSGPRGRIVKEDLHAYVKALTENKPAAAAGGGLPSIPDIDFSQFGEIDIQPRSKLDKLTATNMHRSWVNLPHVTHFDDVDITELELFRKGLKQEAEQRGVKLTPLPFLLKAAAAALAANPAFNASLTSDGESVVYKKYINIGMAVDTPAGLVVPVVRDVDKKSLWQLAEETAELAAKAKDRKLKPADMQGGCFTISSLGNIGGTGFTPIINAPELAILGVSKLSVKPQWDGEQFQPRQMLPLSLSYDHRAINGADAGKFMQFIGAALADIRRLLL